MQEGSNKMKRFILNAVKVILIVLIATAVSIKIFRTDKTISAGEYTITVNKVSTVSVYVSGPGVVLESSNTDQDVYRVDAGTTARFHAINESRIFTHWNITNDSDTIVNSDTNPIISLTNINQNLTVGVARKDATTADYGKYMLDRYVISDENDLIALQNILNGSATNTDYKEFYEDATLYDTAEEKTAIKNAMNQGYFLIANNFVVFNEKFGGLGTATTPFQGVMCGLNNSVVSSIFVTVSVTETTGTNYYGLFKALGQNAVVRNLDVCTTIGINPATSNTGATIYAGGVAGRIDKSLLVNVSAQTKMGIQVTNAKLHVGGIAGITTDGTGFESVGNVSYNGDSTNWTVKSASGTEVNTGLIVGSAQNTYIKSLKVNVTNSVVDVQADSTNTGTNVSLGNVFGIYTCGKNTTIENINIIGTQGQTLRTTVNAGNSNVGGLIGKLTANTTNAYFNIGKVDFNALGSKNLYISTSSGSNSTTNLYTGGIIGFVTGNNCNALESFKNRLSEVVVDGTPRKIFDYLFEGNYEIKSLQNGMNSGTTYGKTIAGGLIGKGFMNVSGVSNTDRSTLLLASPTSNLVISATQSNLTNSVNNTNDKEHASAAMVYGSVGTLALNLNALDIYTNNTTIETLREIGSKAKGDLHTGGLVGYITASKIENVSILLNDSNYKAQSLSYEAKNDGTDTNSAYCGGVVGQATGNSSIKNVIVAGYDTITSEIIGTTSKMESIQNTIPGGDNYKGENYIGGLVGRIQYVTINNCKYIGSEGTEDYIKMSGHESPDSAFCGGLVGMIRTAATTAPSSIENCSIENANVYAAATNRTNYGNPDIYVGGIAGAAYMHLTNSTVSITGCQVYNTDIYGLGNDYIAVYAGGVIGGATWEDSFSINNCYVSSSSVEANLVASSDASYSNAIESAAGGLMGMKGGTVVNIYYSAVIDTTVDATVDYHGTNYNTNLTSHAAGIAAFRESGSFTLINCYSNAVVDSIATLNSTAKRDYYDYIYPVAIECSIGTGTDDYIYYLSKNTDASDTYNRTISVPSTGFASINATARNIYNNGSLSIANLNATHGRGQKLMFVTDSNYFATSRSIGNASTIRCTDMSTYHSALVDVWINSKQNGDTTVFSNSPVEHYGSMKAANDAGWFLFDSVLVDNGETSSITSSDISGINSDYINDSNVIYEFNGNYTTSTVTNTNNALDVITDRYFEETNGNIYNYKIRVYDNMLSLKLNLSFTETADYHLVIAKNANLTDNVDHSIANNDYGLIDFVRNGSNYELIFSPNEKIEEDLSFFIGFEIGDTGVTTTKKIKIELVHNSIDIVGITYAEYTPPLNYYLGAENIGTTEGTAYQLYVGSITKFIPVVTKSNDIVIGTKYALEDYIERYDYKLSNTNVGSLFSSGEITASTTAGRTSTLTLTDKQDSSKSSTSYLITVNQFSVTYAVTGADVNGLTYATSQTDFYFEQVIRSNYGGAPESAVITYNGRDYDITSNPALYDNIYVHSFSENGEISTSRITSWDNDAYGYVVYVKGVSSNIQINISYPLVYTITINLQCHTFNSAYEEEIKLKVKSGTTYVDFFRDNDATSDVDDLADTTVYKQLVTYAEGAGIFGYVFKGFYLVDYASSIPTYGVSLEELAKSSNIINASLTLYARWSFLIELVEAPGTHIVSSFNSSFMEEHYEEDKFNRTIQIPINMNEGYVFTIEKDAEFRGEASVNAYSIQKDGATHIIKEIVLEKYHDNMYLYYVLPEYITGYLLIVTSVSNSEIIVGENTSSVSEEILPEDGVSTFKYIVNHKHVLVAGSTDKYESSYIYNSGKDIDGDGIYTDDISYNLGVKKDFRLNFYEEIYSAGTVTKVTRNLPIGTEIKIYYTVFFDGDEENAQNIVAVYKVTDPNISSVSMKDFKLLDLSTNAFTDQTFGEFLGTHERVSEVYYCVITPPNGYTSSVKDHTINYYIEGGFYDSVRNEYISGIRSDEILANKTDLNFEEILDILMESSNEGKAYTVTPSRQTEVTENAGTYHYTDKKTYEVYDVSLINANIVNGYISLFDDATQSIIESGSCGFDIKELKMTLGYGLGKVRIYGYNGTTWDIIEEVDVTSAVYTEYTVSFMSGLYSKFRIDNISTNEIRINNITVSSRNNGYEYITPVKDLVYKEGVIYSVKSDIIGDVRHEGKEFMLAIQFKDSSGNIIDDIRGSVYITVNGIQYSALLDQIDSKYYGKNVAYINLTQITDILGEEEFDFTITIPSGYTIYSMQLLEVTNNHKPALGEIR